MSATGNEERKMQTAWRQEQVWQGTWPVQAWVLYSRSNWRAAWN